MRGHVQPIIATLFLCSVSAPVFATPVQVIECEIYMPASPLPIDHLDTRFTIRRHIEHTVPFETTETSIWSEGKFQGNGEFEVTVYPFEGGPRTEKSTSTQTIIVDGNGQVGDDYLDQALTMEKTIEYDGYTLDSLGISLKRADGAAISDHRAVPGELDWPAAWDPFACGIRCPVECSVTWRAPGDGVVCALPGGGGTFCTTGVYMGKIKSVTHEPHEQDHGDGDGFAINAGLNDAWVSAGAPLQGMFITVFEELGLVFLAWFTFDAETPTQISTESAGQTAVAAAAFGAGDQRWVTAVGPFNGNRAVLKAELTSGGQFNSGEPMPMQQTDYGEIVLEFDDCKGGKVTFDFPSANQSGEFAIQRTLEDNVALCEAMATE